MVAVGKSVVPLLFNREGFHVGHDADEPGRLATATIVRVWVTGARLVAGGWIAFVGELEVFGGQSDLMEIVLATHGSRRFAGRLNGRQKESDHDTDDGDDDQEFDEGKAAFARFGTASS